MIKNRKGGTILTSILLILVIFVVVIFTVAIVREVNKKKSESGSTQTGTISAAADTNTGSKRKYECKLLSARLGTGYKDEPIIICKYEWTNNSDKPADFTLSFHDQVFQNGIECQTAYMVDSLEGEQSTNIQPGTTYTVEVPYKLNDDKSEVEIIVKEAFSFDDIEYVHTNVKL